ncbi:MULTISPECIES: hypothetical protein [unclassified Nocardia]|uniref:hypothetical protein n=1 Tax=unclassified Nocardia TaxID=2637762 RepID=UPI0033A25B42
MDESVVTQRIGPWEVRMTWRDDAMGGPTGIEIRPASDEPNSAVQHGLSQTVLRQINFRDAMIYRSRSEKAEPSNSESWHMPMYKDRARRLAEDLRRLREDGVTDLYLAALSRMYLELVRQGVRDVSGALAEYTGLTQGGVLQQLKIARKRELLTSMPGRAGGELTPKAVELLHKRDRTSD